MTINILFIKLYNFIKIIQKLVYSMAISSFPSDKTGYILLQLKNIILIIDIQYNK